MIPDIKLPQPQVIVQQPRYGYAIAAVILIALAFYSIVRADQQTVRTGSQHVITVPQRDADAVVTRDTIVIEKEDGLVERDVANQLDQLYRDILALQQDTLEIGFAIADMQAKYDGREFYGNRAELAYAQGRYQRVCRMLYAKQDSLELIATQRH